MKQISRREFLRGSAASAASVALLGAFGPLSSMTVLADGSTVVNVSIAGTVVDISPTCVSDQNEIPIQSTAYQRLFTTPGVSSLELIPVIGKSYEMVDDYTMQVAIFDYVHDNDGNPVTADDIVFSFEKAIEAGTKTDTAYIDSVTAVDDYTVQIKLIEINNTTMVKLLTHINIVTQVAYEENAETTVGTGPYKLTSFVSGSQYVYEKVEDYWQTDADLNAYDQQANVDKIVFECIPETAQVTTALETGEIQMAINVDGLEAKRFEEGGEDEEGFATDRFATMFSNVLLFNDTEDSLCHDVNLRKAILYAINKDAIISIVLNGAGVVAKDMASDALVGFIDAWYDEDYFDYDADKSAEYLAESSYNGETLKLQASADDETLLTLLQAQLSAAGITVEIATYENALWQTLKVAGTGESDWDLCVDGLGGATVAAAWRVKFDPANFTTGLPQTGTTDEELLELLDAAASTESEEDMIVFHDYVKENAYAMGLYATAQVTVTVDTITDICYNYMGYVVPGSCTYDGYTFTE